MKEDRDVEAASCPAFNMANVRETGITYAALPTSLPYLDQLECHGEKMS